MAVNWYWKHKVGEVLLKDTRDNQNWKLEMFGGNMMCCFIHRFRKEENGKMEKYYNFFIWFNDIQHAKRVLKETRLEDLAIGEHKVRKVRLCVTSKDYPYSNKEMLKLASLFAKMGYKVEVY